MCVIDSVKMSKEASLGKFENTPHYPQEITVFSGIPKKVDSSSENPFGPDPLLPKLVADRRFELTGIAAGIQQVMKWEVNEGVMQHSDFMYNPWGRILRSVPEIIGSTTDTNARATAEKIRGYHNLIKGVDENGERYHALNDETFFWPHATFVMAAINVRNRFDRNPLSPAETEKLYQESRIWYSLYGLSNRPVPKDYASFEKKWNDICNNKLEATPLAKTVVDKIRTRTVEKRPDIPEFIWNKMLLKIPGNEVIRILAFGGLQPVLRKKLDIEWSRFDQMKLTAIEEVVKTFWSKEWDPNIPDIRIKPRAWTKNE